MKVVLIGANALHPVAIRHIIAAAVSGAGHELVTLEDSINLDGQTAFNLYLNVLQDAALVIKNRGQSRFFAQAAVWLKNVI